MKWISGFASGLFLLLIHVVLCGIAFVSVSDSSSPNWDLELLFFPNILISAIVAGFLPYQFRFIFGEWSILIWGGIFWFILGAAIGVLIAMLFSKGKEGMKIRPS